MKIWCKLQKQSISMSIKHRNACCDMLKLDMLEVASLKIIHFILFYFSFLCFEQSCQS